MGDIMFLSIHDLHKSYGEKENKLEVLNGINLNVKKVRFVFYLDLVEVANQHY